MKKQRTLIILFIIFAALITAYILLGTLNRHKAAKEAQEAADAVIKITQFSGLSSVSFQNGDTKLEFVKDGDTWYYAADRDIPITQSYLGTVESTFSSLTATRRIANPDSLSEYGLDDPAYTIQVTETDGTAHTFLVGSAAGEDYYLIPEGENSVVYTVDQTVVSSIQYDLDTLVAKDTLPSIGNGNLTQAAITIDGQETIYSADNTGQEATLDTIAGGFQAMELSQCASYHISTEQQEAFGLDEKNRTALELTYTDSAEDEHTFLLYLGAADDAGTGRYVQVDGSSIVYVAGTEVVKNLLGGES